MGLCLVYIFELYPDMFGFAAFHSGHHTPFLAAYEGAINFYRSDQFTAIMHINGKADACNEVKQQQQ